MRIRTVKPEFFEDEGLAALSPYHRLLFIGCWMLADSNGVFENRPEWIKVKVFPYDTGEAVDVSQMLHALVLGNYLYSYSVEGKKYLQVRNFLKHQRLTGKEAQSGGRHPQVGSASGLTTGKHPGSNGETPGKHPDAQEQGTGNREQGTGNGVSIDHSSEGHAATDDDHGDHLDEADRFFGPGLTPTAQQASARNEAPDPDDDKPAQSPESRPVTDFDRWWLKYGKKVGRAKSEAKWARLKKSEQEACMAVVSAFVKSTPDVQYRPNPLTYLNGRRWEDQILQPKNGDSDEDWYAKCDDAAERICSEQRAKTRDGDWRDE